jgi:hypothetical protein
MIFGFAFLIFTDLSKNLKKNIGNYREIKPKKTRMSAKKRKPQRALQLKMK